MIFARKHLSIPYAVFLFLFVILPLSVVLYYAFTDGRGEFTMGNFLAFFSNSRTIGTLFYSIVIAFITTLTCLLTAYPTAYILAKGPFSHGGALLMVVVTPMWINFTLRVTALKEILSVIEGNLACYPFLNTIIGMTYDFLPFMILPIYNVVSRIDVNVVNAARDLGANSFQTLYKVIFPLSIPGVVSGITMVFVPSLTTFVISTLLGGGKILLIGNVIEQEFMKGTSWHVGSGLSLVLMLFIIISMILSSKYDNGEGNVL